jgi:hypothetical protein
MRASLRRPRPWRIIGRNRSPQFRPGGLLNRRVPCVGVVPASEHVHAVGLTRMRHRGAFADRQGEGPALVRRTILRRRDTEACSRFDRFAPRVSAIEQNSIVTLYFRAPFALARPLNGHKAQREEPLPYRNRVGKMNSDVRSWCHE